MTSSSTRHQLSWGLSYRLDDRDERLIGLANGGTAYSVNGDDGNLNFDKGIFSNAMKLTTEIDMAYKNFGAFVRAVGFYDYEIEKGDRERTQLTDDALERVGSRAELLDAFAWLKFNVGSLPAELRVGEQVVSWGESTFIQDGINAINPVDVSALRVPGAELREALLPVGVVWASLSASPRTLTLGGLLPVPMGGDHHRPAGLVLLHQRLRRRAAEPMCSSASARPPTSRPRRRSSSRRSTGPFLGVPRSRQRASPMTTASTARRSAGWCRRSATPSSASTT